MTRLSSAAAIAAVALTCASGLASPAFAQDMERGEYLMNIMDCGGCHTTGALTGQPDPAMLLAGSAVGWMIPDLGVFYPANITPDRETGIGSWTAEEIVTAVRTGVTPEGRELIPVMPWRAYSVLSDEDALALARYLKTIPAVRHEVPGPTPIAEVATPYITIAAPGQP